MDAQVIAAVVVTLLVVIGGIRLMAVQIVNYRSIKRHKQRMAAAITVWFPGSPDDIIKVGTGHSVGIAHAIHCSEQLVLDAMHPDGERFLISIQNGALVAMWCADAIAKANSIYIPGGTKLLLRSELRSAAADRAVIAAGQKLTIDGRGSPFLRSPDYRFSWPRIGFWLGCPLLICYAAIIGGEQSGWNHAVLFIIIMYGMDQLALKAELLKHFCWRHADDEGDYGLPRAKIH
jgi:hypothetical protein